MAREEVGVDLTARDKASPTVDKVADKIEDLERKSPTELELDTDDNATPDLKQVEERLERLDRQKVDVPVDVDTRPTEDGLRRVADNADQSRSVLANMVGNSTQELGELGGVAGTAGVAIGQLAEYAADGNIKLKSLVGLGVGMVALGVASKVISDHFANIAESKAFSKEKVAGWVDAMRDGAQLTKAIADSYRDAGKVEVEIGDDIVDLTDTLATAGVSAQQFAELTAMSAEEIGAWGTAMKAAGADARAVELVVVAAASEADDFADAEAGAAAAATVFGDSVKGSADKLAAHREGLEQASAAAHDWLDAQIAATDANFAAADAQTAFTDAVANTSAVMADSEATAADLEAAVRAERDAAIASAAASARLAEEFAAANGEAATAEQKLDAMNTTLLESARTATPAARDQIIQYIAQVNNIPVEKATEIVANADTAAAEADLNNVARRRTAQVDVEFNVQKSGTYVGGTFIPGYFPTGQAATPATPITNVTVHMPRGTRGADVMRGVRQYERRNGRR